MSKTIMVFAAGLGSRMKGYTEHTPKPLIKILGKPILAWVLDLVAKHDFKKIIINTHHFAPQIHEFISSYQASNSDLPKIIISHEEELLETGGGLKNALKYVDEDNLFTINSDSILQSKLSPFPNLIDAFDPSQMDIIVLSQPKKLAFGYHGAGDFKREENCLANFLSPDKEFIYPGLQLLKTKIVEEYPLKVFSLDHFFKDSKYKVYSLINDGPWFHLTFPEDISLIENNIS